MDPTLITPRQEVENYHFPAADHFADPASGLLYCAIPKCGCSTGKRWFLSIAEPEILALPQPPDFHERCRERWALCLIEDAEERRRLTDRLFAFAFVRHPLERIASAFTEKFTLVHRNELFLPAKELVERFEAERDDAATGVSFTEFVAYLAAAPDDALDAHWRPQVSFLSLRSDYFIAPIERLTETIRIVSDALGRAVAELPSINLTPYSASHARTDSPETLASRSSADLYAEDRHPRARELYTRGLKTLVRSRFAADAELHQRALEGWSEAGVRRALARFLSLRDHPSTPAATPTM